MKRRLQKRAIFLAWLLVVACLGAERASALEGATNPPVPPPAELQKILATYEAYQALSPAEKAKAARPVFAYPDLSSTAAE